MHHTSKLPIVNLNPHLTCSLCGGYFIDATTIVECLHSFCKSCIVRYLETNKFCPVCDVQIHKTKPLLHIRSDQTLQAVVYKLVPGLFQYEMRLRKEFYDKNPDEHPTTPEDRGESDDIFIYSSEEIICLSLEYADSNPESSEHILIKSNCDDLGDYSASKRYLRCPAAVSVALLKHLIRAKYGLDPNHALDILYGDSFLCDEYSLVDIAYIFDWKRKGPMNLRYRIYQETDLQPSLLVTKNIVQPAIKTNECLKTTGEPDSGTRQKVEKETITLVGEAEIESMIIERSNLKKEKEEIEESSNQNSPLFNAEVLITKEKNCMPVYPSNHETNSSPLVISTDTAPSNLASIPKSMDQNGANSLLPSLLNGQTVHNTKDPMKNVGAEVPNKMDIAFPDKSLKLPPKTWSPMFNRVAAKRSASDSKSVTGNNSNVSLAKKLKASLSKPSRDLKLKSVTLSAVSEDVISPSSTSTSVASVTESVVQEVAVNLTKPSITPKKSEKEKAFKDSHSLSPAARPGKSSPSLAQIHSGPPPSQSTKSSLHAGDVCSKLKSSASSHSILPFVPSTDDASQTPRYPAWLNLARSATNRSGTMFLAGSPYPNRIPLTPNHFLTSFIASHSPYSYLTQLGLQSTSSGKKTTISGNPSGQQVHKLLTTRNPGAFPVPSFSLSSMQHCTYPSGITPIPPLSRELVTAFYQSACTQSRDFLPSAHSSESQSCGSPKSSSSSSLTIKTSVSSCSSNTPLATVVNSVSSSNEFSKSTKPSDSRSSVTRRTGALPPALVPIGSTPSLPVRLLPTLLPIKGAVDSEQISTTAESSTHSLTVQPAFPENSFEYPGNSCQNQDKIIAFSSEVDKVCKDSAVCGKIEDKHPEDAGALATTAGLNCSVDSTPKTETSQAKLSPASAELNALSPSEVI